VRELQALQLVYVASHCSVMQCAVVCCRVLQYVAVKRVLRARASSCGKSYGVASVSRID